MVSESMELDRFLRGIDFLFKSGVPQFGKTLLENIPTSNITTRGIRPNTPKSKAPLILQKV